MLPSSALSPNARVDWHTRYDAAWGKGSFGQAVYLYCVDYRNRQGASFKPLPKAILNLTFVFRRERRRDPDNLIASFKAGLDAIVRAGLLEDDKKENLTIGSIIPEVDRQRAPLTIIELVELSIGTREGKSDSRGA